MLFLLSPLRLDVVQALPLAKAMFSIPLRDPAFVPSTIMHVGFESFFGWFGHFIMLNVYTVLYVVLKSLKSLDALPIKTKFRWNRWIESFEYGSGLDYKL